MHSETIRDAPGDCPKCGMALESMGVTSGDEELVDFRRRFLIGAVMTVPLLVLTMGPFLRLGFVRDLLGERTAQWVKLALGTSASHWRPARPGMSGSGNACSRLEIKTSSR